MADFHPPSPGDEVLQKWGYDWSELCTCGHPGTDHCLEDGCCWWDVKDHKYGGACSSRGCGCGTYRPRSMHPDEVEE